MLLSALIAISPTTICNDSMHLHMDQYDVVILQNRLSTMDLPCFVRIQHDTVSFFRTLSNMTKVKHTGSGVFLVEP